MGTIFRILPCVDLSRNVSSVMANATTVSGSSIARAINRVGTNATAYASIHDGHALAKSVVVYRYMNGSSVGARATATMVRDDGKKGRVESGVEVVDGDVM